MAVGPAASCCRRQSRSVAFRISAVPTAQSTDILEMVCARSAKLSKRGAICSWADGGARRSGLHAAAGRLADRHFPVPAADAAYRERGQRRSPARSRPDGLPNGADPPNCNDEASTSCLAASLKDCQAKVAMTPIATPKTGDTAQVSLCSNEAPPSIFSSRPREARLRA